MAITVPFELAYEFEVNALAADVFDLLSDVSASASLFPKLHKLVNLEGNCYRWELDKVGPAQMKGIVAPMVLGENQEVVEHYIANLTQRFGGKH